jgi:nickel transport protein
LLIALAAWVPVAWAHRVNVWAAFAGDEVVCRATVGRGPAKDCLVRAYLSDGRLLTEGRTDDAGRFSFKPGAKADLRIVLEAGEGHRDEFMLAADRTAGEAAPAQAGDTAASTPSDAVATPDEARLRQVVGEVVDRKLRERLDPLIDRLASASNREAGLTEILGGIGYILGIMGVAMYFRARHRGTQGGA